MEWIYRREKARIAGAITISGIITEGLFSHSSRLQDFSNHSSILLHLSEIFLLLLLHKEFLLQCLMEFYDDGFSL